MIIPHPIPYQGSKRNLASRILCYFPAGVHTLIEPFAGSGAISLAAAAKGMARRYHLNDLNKPLMDLWNLIINEPEKIARQYEDIWNAQHHERRSYYDRIRDEFNKTGRPDYFLYLLARCVKASVRYNANGEFNQSPDNRRKGALPKTMRMHILGASYILKGKSMCSCKDYRDVIQNATAHDLVYMDPPYQGVCSNRDPRYLKNVEFEEFVEALEFLNSRDISYIISYDGRTGNKAYGKKLPGHLELCHEELFAGRSTQATLLGRNATTVESLYLSPALVEKIKPIRRRSPSHRKQVEQLSLLESQS
jgi:DNA adenine methylase